VLTSTDYVRMMEEKESRSAKSGRSCKPRRRRSGRSCKPRRRRSEQLSFPRTQEERLLGVVRPEGVQEEIRESRDPPQVRMWLVRRYNTSVLESQLAITRTEVC